MAPPRPGSIAEATRLQGKRPYGEESRRYRRTIFRHEDWLKHRSETRLLRNLQGTFTSGVVRSLLSEVAAVMFVSLLVILWNAAFFGYSDLSNAPQPGLFGDSVPAFLHAQLPIALFTLSSPALGLLLVFRTNTSYSRWLEARQAWGRIVSHCRNIMRQSTLWIDLDSSESGRCLEEVSLCVWAFPRSLWAHLSDPAKEPRFAAEVEAAMGAEAAAGLLAAKHRPLRALALLSGAMDRLPIDEKKKVEMDKSVILLGDACETCERIFSSPVPLVYTRHTARFLSAWLLLLPLGLYDAFASSWNHAALLPAATIVSIFLFGIEELAVQLEEPFSILPLEALCADVRCAADDLVAGMPSSRAPLAAVRPAPLRSTRSGGGATMVADGRMAPSIAQQGSAGAGMRESCRRANTFTTTCGGARSGRPQMLAADPSPLVSPLLEVLPAAAGELGSLATSAVSPLLAALSTFEQRERYFLAGGLCASISHALATPIDVVKTKQQTVAAYGDLSLLEGLERVVRDDGPAALLTGIAPTVVGYGAEGALKFGAYEALKPTAAALLASLGLGAEQCASFGPICAAVVAGGLASLVLAPAEGTRIRMVSDPSYAGLGLGGAALKLYVDEGAAGLLRGVPATCSKQLPYTATKQVTFDALVDVAAKASPLVPRWASTAGAAASAAVLSTLASQPGDAILSEVSRGGGGGGGDGGAGGAAEETDRSIWAAVVKLGPAGLGRGLPARLVQVGIIVTVQLVLYDTLKHAFGVP